MNDEITNEYFRSKNQHNAESLVELMCKINRLEELSHNYCRIKNAHVLQLCKSAGHNSHTCMSKQIWGMTIIVIIQYSGTHISVSITIFLHPTEVIKGDDPQA